MGDVFDRIVSRATVAPERSPAASLTMRRRPSFGVLDASGSGARVEDRAWGEEDALPREVEVERGAGEGGRSAPEAGAVGSETGRVTAASGRRAPGPLGPASPATPPLPQNPGRGGENEPEPGSLRRPRRARSTGEPAREQAGKPPRLEPDRKEEDPAGPRPDRLDLSPQRAPLGVARPGQALAARDVTAPATLLPVPGGQEADAVAGRADVEAQTVGMPDAGPSRADLRVRPRSSRPDPAAPPTRAMPAEELLREHLAPALVDRGALSAQDVARLTAVGLDPLEVPAGGDVHVHQIGRAHV